MNINKKNLNIRDICGLIIKYKERNYHYFAYLHNKLKKSNAKRLIAKISADELIAIDFYKKYYEKINNIYKKNIKNDDEIFKHFYYSIIIAENPISNDKKKWKKELKNIYNYNDVFELYNIIYNDFRKFMYNLLYKVEEDKIKETIKKFIIKEQTYIKSLKIIIDKLEGVK